LTACAPLSGEAPGATRGHAPRWEDALLERLFRKLDRRDPLHPEERRALEANMSPPRTWSAGQELVAQDSVPHESTLLLSGLTARVNTLYDGSSQITALHIPGDFVDLHSFLLNRMDHSVMALADCVVSSLSHPRLRTLTARFPHMTRLLWLSTLLDSAIHRQWIVGMGRRDARSQCAHLLCEMFLRLEVVGLTSGRSFELPLSQGELANALGRSRATVNATLQRLRTDGLITWRGVQIEILDWRALVELAEFDPTYLQLEAMPV
jgi:CRP-like cAMP-binding protein